MRSRDHDITDFKNFENNKKFIMINFILSFCKNYFFKKIIKFYLTKLDIS